MDTDDNSSNINSIFLNNDEFHQIYLFLEKIKSWLFDFCDIDNKFNL